MTIGQHIDWTWQVYLAGFAWLLVAALLSMLGYVWLINGGPEAAMRYVRRRWVGLAALLALSVGTAHAGDAPSALAFDAPTLDLYVGRLLSVEQDNLGAYRRGSDLYAVRMVATVAGPFGLRAGFRGDLTSLGYLDPSSLEIGNVRTAEAYTALSWSYKAKGFSFGPAVFAGAVVPVQDSVSWRMKAGWGGGARIGFDRSWVYVTVGKDAASDEAAGLGTSPARFIAPFSLEVWHVSAQGEVVSGPGGRARIALMVRVPNPWGGQ